MAFSVATFNANGLSTQIPKPDSNLTESRAQIISRRFRKAKLPVLGLQEPDIKEISPTPGVLLSSSEETSALWAMSPPKGRGVPSCTPQNGHLSALGAQTRVSAWPPCETLVAASAILWQAGSITTPRFDAISGHSFPDCATRKPLPTVSGSVTSTLSSCLT
jgi:hypothetical protein